MAASVSSSGGCYPVGKDLGLGCAVRLCGLNSAKGKELNGQVGIIEGESNHRFQVKLQVKKKEVYVESSKDVLLIKPENLYLVCNCCYKDNATLKTCAGCSTVWYCGADCQRRHWKEGGHRQVCKGRRKNVKQSDADKETAEQVKQETDGKWLKSMDHPSWTSKLSRKQRRALREHHVKSGCTVAWPVTNETDAMLEPPSPCFLARHPNMRFKVSIANLPGGFTMNYGQGREDPLGVSGKKAPAGKCIALLKEKFPENATDPRDYFKEVPLHGPIQLVYGIIADQVLWTKYDYDDLDNFYKTQRSQFFNWPGVECVGVCPGTGKVVPFSMTEKHLLAVCELQGSVLNETSGEFHLYTRIFPRILTKEGYDKMLGPKGSEQRLVRWDMITSGGVKQAEGTMELYPDALGNVKESSGFGLINFSAKYKKQGITPFASMAYSDFHESGMYKSFERLCEDEREKNHGTTIGDVQLKSGRTQSGFGKSQY